VESSYIAGAEVPSFDSKINTLVEQAADSFGGGGKPMDVGVENEQGDVYRQLRCWGMGEFLRLTQGMLELGFEDRLRDALSQGGLDSRFAVTQRVFQTGRAFAFQLAEASPLSDIESHTASLAELPVTERESVVQSRFGQGVFRQQLVDYWGGCSVTGAVLLALLRASHIKPWRVATNAERLDRYNGLLLTPALDAAFDAGLITFDGSGRIAIAATLAGKPAYDFHISPKMRLNRKKLREEHEGYLAYHREHVFERGQLPKKHEAAEFAYS
jgi:hypothetical protein